MAATSQVGLQQRQAKWGPRVWQGAAAAATRTAPADCLPPCLAAAAAAAGTSACPNGHFYCQNKMFIPLLLNSSMVDDGVCGALPRPPRPPLAPLPPLAGVVCSVHAHRHVIFSTPPPPCTRLPRRCRLLRRLG